MSRRLRALVRVSPAGPVLGPDAVRAFLAVKSAEGRAPSTLRDYEKATRLFFRFAGEPPATEDELRTKVLAFLQTRASLAPPTYNLSLVYLRGFFRWCISEGLLTSDPTRGIHKRADGGRPRALPEDTLRRLVALPDRTRWAGLRDQALLLLMLDTGIRPSEALGLLPVDVDLVGAGVVVRAAVAKTRRDRALPLSPVTVRALGALLRSRPAQWDVSAPVLAREDGGRLATQGLRERFKLYSRQLGQKVTPYMLRHSFALLYLRGGGDAFSLQRLLGHTGLAMTKRYVELAEADVAAVHARASPVGRLVSEEKQRVRRLKRGP